MLELYGAKGCPYTRELRESLLWDGEEFVEYDVETDPKACDKLISLTGRRTVPVLVRDGHVVQIGFQGRGCTVSPPVSKNDACS
jgi:mycoredoxin